VGLLGFSWNLSSLLLTRAPVGGADPVTPYPGPLVRVLEQLRLAGSRLVSSIRAQVAWQILARRVRGDLLALALVVCGLAWLLYLGVSSCINAGLGGTARMMSYRCTPVDRRGAALKTYTFQCARSRERAQAEREIGGLLRDEAVRGVLVSLQREEGGGPDDLPARG
jgi:hypothetical protein